MHVQKYMTHGLEYKGMSPDEFMNKLTDYDNEDNKPLNFISVSSLLFQLISYRNSCR